MGAILIKIRGSGRPTKQISIATHAHSWRGRFYLYSCFVEIFLISDFTQNKSQSDIISNINSVFQRAMD
jgi:hypothetical protein